MLLTLLAQAAEAVEHPPVAKAWVQVAQLVIAVGLAYLASRLAEEPESPTERPTPLSSRGSYVGWFLGVRRMEYVMTWAGNRFSRKADSGGKGKGKSSGSSSNRNYFEDAMHAICVGPVHALTKIEQGGETIFDGYLTPDIHPSGTLVDLGGEGSFRIFWGEDDQPVNTYLGDSERIGVTSRWPNWCYIEWRAKKMGMAPRWPAMSYTMLREPTGNYLSDTDPFSNASFELTGSTYDILEAHDTLARSFFLDASALTHEDLSSELDVGKKLRLTGNSGLSDRDLTVEDWGVDTIEFDQTGSGITTNPNVTYYRRATFITVEEDLTGMADDGQVQLYESQDDDGANAAHVIADMLFEPWPQGLGLSQDDWDMDSLEDLGTLSFNESVLTSWKALKGQSVKDLLGPGMQDLGFMLPLDPNTGKLRFYPLREPSGTVEHLDDKLIIDNLPELTKDLQAQPNDFLIFEFPDRANNFRKMTIGRMADGTIGQMERANAQKVPLSVVVTYEAAMATANRRSQETLVQQTVWAIEAARATRLWFPGMPITADFTNENLRVIEVRPLPDSGKVELDVMLDTYGIEAQNASDSSPPITGGRERVERDIFSVAEVSEYVSTVPPQRLLPLRIRSHDQVDGAVIHLSAAGTTYSAVLNTEIHHTGGRLQAELPADEFFEPEDGTILIEALGPDISNALDLTGDDESWRGGRQLAVIVSAAGWETCFLKKVTAVSPGVYSLDGLIRARFETRRLTHPATSSVVYIVDTQDVDTFTNALLEPGKTRSLKSQPFGFGTILLSEIDAVEIDLYGKGTRPPACAGLRVTAPELVNAYGTGDDVTVKWNYPSPQASGSSAGLQAAGQAVGDVDPEGEFLVEFQSAAGGTLHTDTVSSPTITYTNAEIVSHQGGFEVDFKVSVSQLRDGRQSEPVTITVEKI